MTPSSVRAVSSAPPKTEDYWAIKMRYYSRLRVGPNPAGCCSLLSISYSPPSPNRSPTPELEPEPTAMEQDAEKLDLQSTPFLLSPPISIPRSIPKFSSSQPFANTGLFMAKPEDVFSPSVPDSHHFEYHVAFSLEEDTPAFATGSPLPGDHMETGHFYGSPYPELPPPPEAPLQHSS